MGIAQAVVATIFQLAVFRVTTAKSMRSFSGCMKQQLGGATRDAILFLPGSKGYNARLGWSFQPDPADLPTAFVDCNSTFQIISAVMCAKNNAVGVCPRSGGHSFIGSSMCSGVVIDLWQLKGFSLSRNGTSVTVGAGLTLGELSFNLYNQTRGIFPVGHSRSVGIAGFVLQGGLTELSSEIGLGCDNLEEVRMVKPNGKIITANAKKNPDVFWASCGGGGGKLGVVFELTLRVSPSTRYDSFVGFSATLRNLSAVPSVLRWVYQWREGSYSILSRSKIRINTKTRINDFLLLGACVACSSTSECENRLLMSGFYDFPWDHNSTIQGRTALDYLEFMAEESFTNVSYWLSSDPSHSEGSLVQGNFTFTGLGFNYTLSRAPPLRFFKNFLSLILDVCFKDDNRCTIFVQNLDVGITGIDANATAIFGLRQARQWVGFRCAGATLQIARRISIDLRQYFSEFMTGSFLNWEDAALENYTIAYWGNNAARLIKINRNCDPNVLFLSKQPLIEKSVSRPRSRLRSPNPTTSSDPM
mmetsp:Transcript_8486/g.17202  ORF Transcript_8486/g.17202 Transcript_8486/m.17202 type:complete len:531 (-) Transcript_8486:235-1827(-)